MTVVNPRGKSGMVSGASAERYDVPGGVSCHCADGRDIWHISHHRCFMVALSNRARYVQHPDRCAGIARPGRKAERLVEKGSDTRDEQQECRAHASRSGTAQIVFSPTLRTPAIGTAASLRQPYLPPATSADDQGQARSPALEAALFSSMPA